MNTIIALVCTVIGAAAPIERQFTIYAPLSDKPRATFYDAPLMDPPTSTPAVRRIVFSNQCDNYFSVELNAEHLTGGPLVAGQVTFLDPDGTDTRMTALVLCRPTADATTPQEKAND